MRKREQGESEWERSIDEDRGRTEHRRSERALTETDRGEREQGERKRRSERENRARVSGDGASMERAGEWWS